MTPEIKKLENQIHKLRRDYLVENLFVSEHVIEECDLDDTFHIHIIKAFDKQWIALDGNHFSIDRVWVDSDGSVWAASGQDYPFLPTISQGDSHWYCGDEILEIGKWTDEDTQRVNLPQIYDPELGKSVKIFDHTHLMCIPKVETLRVSNQTMQIIASIFFTEHQL